MTRPAQARLNQNFVHDLVTQQKKSCTQKTQNTIREVLEKKVYFFSVHKRISTCK